MAPQTQIENLAQDVYLVVKGRQFDGIEDEDGQAYVSNIIRWGNMFLSELESQLDAEGHPVNWWFARQNGYSFGTANTGAFSLALPTGVNRLMTDDERYVQILQDGTPVSNWAVVSANDIGNKQPYGPTEDMCAVVGTSLVFSRPFNDTEQGGEIIGDVVVKLPRLSLTNTKAIGLIKPDNLLTLGIAKNVVLPDIVQGSLYNSYAQQYKELLGGAIAQSQASSIAPLTPRQNFSGIGGV